jgi:hypothetical protein
VSSSNHGVKIYKRYSKEHTYTNMAVFPWYGLIAWKWCVNTLLMQREYHGSTTGEPLEQISEIPVV